MAVAELPAGAGGVQSPAAPAAPSAAKLKGLQKAAVLLVSMGEEKAAQVLRHLSQDEAEALSLEIAKAGRVPSEVSKSVIAEALENVLADSYVAEGGVEYARSLLE